MKYTINPQWKYTNASSSVSRSVTDSNMAATVCFIPDVVHSVAQYHAWPILIGWCNHLMLYTRCAISCVANSNWLMQSDVVHALRNIMRGQTRGDPAQSIRAHHHVCLHPVTPTWPCTSIIYRPPCLFTLDNHAQVSFLPPSPTMFVYTWQPCTSIADPRTTCLFTEVMTLADPHYLIMQMRSWP